jgi:hypothetical protein
MTTRFSGTIEELKAKLNSLGPVELWTQINPNQHQFRHPNGGLMNWFPSTGSINFQGKPIGRDELQAQVEELLQRQGATISATTESVEPITQESINTSNAPSTGPQAHNLGSHKHLIGAADSLGALQFCICLLLR